MKETYYLLTAPDRVDLYWRPHSQGYTTSIAEAGVYSKQEATRIVNNKRGDKMIDMWSIRKDINALILEASEHIKLLNDKLDILMS